MNVLELPLSYLLEEVAFVLRPERVITLQNHEQEYAQTPKVGVDGYVVPFGDYLRRHISWSPTESVDGVGRSRLKAEAEINQLQLLVSVEENVLSFDIPVNNVPFVQILKSLRDRLEHLLRLRLLQPMLRLRQQIIIQRISTPILLYQINLRRTFDNINQLSNNWMIQFGQDINFPLKILQFIRLIQPLLLIYLDCYFLV